MDEAYDQIEQLLGSDTTSAPLYEPMLNRAWLLALQGNILWARGNYEQAIATYQSALQHADQMSTYNQALLTNNLAAIWLDAEDPSAAAAMGDAVQLLEGQDLGALRFNLGLLAENQGRFMDARTELQQAQNLLPSNTTLLISLARAYRQEGQLEAARRTLSAAQNLVGHEVDHVPQDVRQVHRLYLTGLIQEEDGLIQLAQQIGARGPLEWEVELAQAQPDWDIAPAVVSLRNAIQTSEQMIQEWRALATSNAAAETIINQVTDPGASMIEDGQAWHAEQEVYRKQYHLALGLIEQDRSQNTTASNDFFDGLRAIFLGQGQQLQEAENILRAHLDMHPEDTASRVAFARIGRLRYMRQQNQDRFDAAIVRYDELMRMAPQEPAGYYGKGVLMLQRGDAAQARQLMEQALLQNPAYYPARTGAALAAISQDDWAAAINHLEIQAQQYPVDSTWLMLGRALRESGPGQYEQARQVLLTLNQAQALARQNNAATLIELGRLDLATGQLERAEQYFAQARQADPQSSEAALELGHLLVQQGNYEQAAEQFQAAIAHDSRNVDARLALADLYVGPLDDVEQANEQYHQLMNIGVERVDTLMQIGNALLDRGISTTAERAFRQAIGRRPDDPRLHHGLGQSLLMQQKLAAARMEEERSLALITTTDQEAQALRVKVLVALGDVERLDGRLDKAVERYNQALTLYPLDVQAKLGLGQVLVARGSWDIALSHFQDAVNAPGGNTNPTAYFWLAEATLRQVGPAEATHLYNRALELHPEFPEALLGLAQAQDAQGMAEAMTTVQQAINLRPEYPEALLFAGKLAQQRGQLDEAFDYYTASIEASGRLAEPYHRRGIMYMQQQNYPAATRDLQRAAQLNPGNTETWYWLGRSYFTQNRLPEALNAFERAVALSGGNYTEARLYQGMVESEMGALDQATASFLAVMESANANEWVARANAELERLGRSQ
ncbi:MAG: tetratricopeptide repeat protein [Chloroflexaceae bacterium]|nr:tetratricopeptide repeat protein [Chloroflexaceae bacterium]